MNDQKLPWQAALPALYQRAATDAAFRARCLSDARAALREVADVEIPSTLKLRFADQVDELVIPLPPVSDGRLAMDDLDAVAGGAVNVGTGYTGAPTVYVPFGYGYGNVGGSVWPPVDPNTPSGLPPMINPGGAPPGYNS